MNNLPFITSTTDLAAYLILSGFELLGIQYEPRSDGKPRRGFYIFRDDPHMEDYKNSFENNQARVNVNDLEELKRIKSGLLDRVMQGKP